MRKFRFEKMTITQRYDKLSGLNVASIGIAAQKHGIFRYVKRCEHNLH